MTIQTTQHHLKLLFETLKRHKVEITTNNLNDVKCSFKSGSEKLLLCTVEDTTKTYWTEIQSNQCKCLTSLSTDQ